MHNLIVGNSYSGKSNLAKYFAKQAVLKGESVIVYDPLKSTGWPETARKYADPEKFLQDMDTFINAHVFVDEAKTLWDHDWPRSDKLLYQKRHDGILVYVIAQRTKMVPPNARNQCSKLFAFKQQTEDAKILAAEYDEALIAARALSKGEFLVSNGFHSMAMHLDYSKGLPPVPRSD